jgi:NAD(P)-dependent dehydrogenase (short-subunit alcohol dehydrogenase family)
MPYYSTIYLKSVWSRGITVIRKMMSFWRWRNFWRMVDYKQKVAVVTGASSGIGKAIVLALATEEATLCLVGRDLKSLDAVAVEVQRDTNNVQCYQADLTLDQDIAQLTKRLENDFGRVDVLVHSAGVINLGKLGFALVGEFDSQYRTNLRAPYLLTQALLPMLKKYQGQIVFINSSAGLNPGGGNMGPYSATKHALRALTDSLRVEVNPYGIRVLSVYPGRTATPMQAHVYKMEGKTYRPERLLQPMDVASIVVHALNLPRTAEVTDISIRPMMKA